MAGTGTVAPDDRSDPGETSDRLHRGSGTGRRKARPFHKGRQAERAALVEIRALLCYPPRPRDLLLEHLHLIPHHFGPLSHRLPHALSLELRLALAECWGVATRPDER